jgi:hypothetical protein
MTLPARSAVVERPPISIVAPTLSNGSERDLSCEVVKIAHDAERAAQDLRASGKRGGIGSMIFRPIACFVRDYLVRGGWRDGPAGFAVAAMSAFAVFLKYAALVLSD